MTTPTPWVVIGEGGSFICLRCDHVANVELPIDVMAYVAFSKAYVELHRECGDKKMDVNPIVKTAERTNDSLASKLLALGLLQEEDVTQFHSKQYGVPGINLALFGIAAEIIALIPRDVAAKHQVIPVNRSGSSLIVAMSDPSNIVAIDDIRSITGYNIEVVVASVPSIKDAMAKYYGPRET